MKRKLEDNEVLFLNVGSTLLSTTRSTLVNSLDFFPNSILAVMFSKDKEESIPRDKSGNYFIDADGDTFRHVLNVLRRPILLEDYVPPNMSYEAWCQELVYWGLVDKKDKIESVEVEHKPYEMKTLVEIGDSIKKEIMDNEQLVIKTIMEATGYYKSTGKARSSTLCIPIGKYELPWGCDIGGYVDTHKKTLHQLLVQMMGGSSFCTVNIFKSMTKKDHSNYLFDSVSYSTQDLHMSITLEFNLSL